VTFENELFEQEEVAERKAKPVGGGYYTVGKTEYWFPQDLYDQVMKADDETPLTRAGDKAFAKWIKKFIKDHEGEVEALSNYGRSRSFGSKSYGSGMSGYWAMPYTYTGHWKNSDPDTVKLATILRAMRTVLSVVDPTHKLSVKYSDDHDTSSWSGNQVILPVHPARNIKDLEEAINVMSGFTTHEAWHSKFTRAIVDNDPATFKELMKSPVNRFLFNVVEDVREEELGIKETPGYREYINFVMEFLWNDKKIPKEWPDDSGTQSNIDKKAKAFYMFLREQDRADEMLTDASFAAPRAWFDDWTRRYCDELTKTPTVKNVEKYVAEARKYLELPDDPPAVESLASEIVILTPCAYTEGDNGLSAEGQEGVAEAIEAEAEKVDDRSWLKHFGWHKDSFVIHDDYEGNMMESAIILKPRVKNASGFKSEKSSLIEKAKATLSLRKMQAQNDTRLMRSGELDEDELHRFFQQDMRIFKDATVETLPDAAIYLLVDMSGSMGAAQYENTSSRKAVRIAQVFVEALSRHPNIKVRVLGHTGDNIDSPSGGAFYRIWEQGDPINRLQYFYEMHSVMGDNYDGYAIAWAGQLLRNEPVQQRLLIVLSDGQPAGYGYGGKSAHQHVRTVTDKLIQQGVDVVQVAVHPGIGPEVQSQMFKHFVMFNTDKTDPFADILNQLTKLLRKFTG
jgi:hypothetical protein